MVFWTQEGQCQAWEKGLESSATFDKNDFVGLGRPRPIIFLVELHESNEVQHICHLCSAQMSQGSLQCSVKRSQEDHECFSFQGAAKEIWSTLISS
jgi:hypothetical protein